MHTLAGMWNGMRLPGKGMGWGEFFGALRTEWQKDRATDAAGMVTFAGILALFPFLLFLVALGSLLIDPAQAQALVDQLARIAPADVTGILGERLHSLSRQDSSGLLTVSAVVAIWSASGGMAALTRALNTIYGVQESRPIWKVRGRALLMTLFAALLALVAALLAVGAPAIGNAIGGRAGEAITWLRLPVAGLLVMFVWACLYYFLPDVEQEFRFITPGSVVGVVLWVIASWAFSRYVSSFGRYEVTYGALGGVIVLLLWMWISAQVLLLGAEINAIIEHRSPEGKEPGARRAGELSRGKKTEPRGEKALEPQVVRVPAPHVPPLVSRQAVRDRKTRLWVAAAGVAVLFRWLRSRSTSNGKEPPLRSRRASQSGHRLLQRSPG